MRTCSAVEKRHSAVPNFFSKMWSKRAECSLRDRSGPRAYHLFVVCEMSCPAERLAKCDGEMRALWGL